MDIFERMKQGELILENDPEYSILYEALLRGMRITGIKCFIPYSRRDKRCNQ